MKKLALVKLGPEIVEVRRRFGGVYFRTDPKGQHIQAMPRHVKRAESAAWGMGRDMWSMGTGIWLMALLLYYGVLWTLFAASNYFTDKRGERKRITGFNWYMHYAMRFPETQQPPFWKPPHSIGEMPDYYVSYKGMWMYDHAPPDWPDECPGDYYWPGLEWHGKPSYRTDNLVWYLWWKDTRWVLSEGLDYEGVGKTFYSSGENIQDYYKNPVTNTWAHVYPGKREE